ncbi:uncharacterized protein [Macrobrachium rosenbergii]|uniref:uncharacterized protein n=1 Tax=Macrobrachium rosenbergii TaxID=79674 RepID=UPI0034D7A566
MKLLCSCLLFVLLKLSVADEPPKDVNAKFLAAYSTRTIITLTTQTSIIPFTCANYFGTSNCQKRRFRRVADIRIQSRGDASTELDSALLENPEADSSSTGIQHGANRQALALTIWSTTSSTFTITSTSTNTSTTFSLSFYCSIVSASFPSSCG